MTTAHRMQIVRALRHAADMIESGDNARAYSIGPLGDEFDTTPEDAELNARGELDEAFDSRDPQWECIEWGVIIPVARAELGEDGELLLHDVAADPIVRGPR
jgi:hypothetical protein